ncbi:hypothetical protein [Haloferula sp. BvORR071]|uniref:hypothetical protein n=1 Tax=Haloferula sp. BvORR071 TaxID=1396141 RepID=UPI00055232B1|nr:hypothetical protein [Haloferula sp. BvORR071]
MHRPFLLALLLAAPLCHADPLSQADKQALLEKLDTLRDEAKSKAMSRVGGAVAAFRTAMASDDAAMELYLKCVEKVDFEDQKKSSQDFREWKRRQADRLDNPGFKVTLRHQLRWLVMTLEAAEKPEKIADLAPRASEALSSIYDNPDQFGGDADSLRQPVTSTVFARAYSLGGLKLEKWPPSPLENAAVFEQVIMPPLRAKQNFDAMREQWARRIRYEGIARQSFGGGGGGRRGERGGEKGKPHEDANPDYEKFVVETLPELQWQMEMDLYKSGDQKRSALKMLEHIEAHVTHPKARDWGQQFRGLIEPPKGTTDPAPETADK